MHTRTTLFEQWLQYSMTTYCDTWPPTLTDVIGLVIGLLAAVITLLAVKRNSYTTLRIYIPAFLNVFILSRK